MDTSRLEGSVRLSVIEMSAYRVFWNEVLSTYHDQSLNFIDNPEEMARRLQCSAFVTYARQKVLHNFSEEYEA